MASYPVAIPAVGPITASALSAQLGNGKQYARSRDFAASGGRNTLLGISKRGDKNLRWLRVQCARVFIQNIAPLSGKLADWVKMQLTRKHSCVACCALANKLARIA
ncbi:transposase (fragment) [Xenorhabdus bovienii]|uniref:Transposase n=1 Tax=Xenorhabdus bovienii TaxID=40576 RepID=A0A0B6X2B3_XENBV